MMVREELRQNETFVFKDFHLQWAENMQERKRYAIVAFRKSMKSTMLRLRAMWKLHRLKRGEPNPEYEGLYLSAKEELAAKHRKELIPTPGYPWVITAAEFENKFCQPGYWDLRTKSDWDDLFNARWVVFDDLGVEDPNNSKFQVKLVHFFGTRHRIQRTLIILTNVMIEEYGERIVSRVRDWGVDGSVWEIQGEDLRKNKRDLNPVAD